MFKHILVPLDGSLLAEQALPVAGRLAHTTGGTITLLHVVDVSHAYVVYGAMQPLITPDAVNSSLASGENYLDSVLSRSELAGVSIEKKVVIGHPAIEILSIKQSTPRLLSC